MTETGRYRENFMGFPFRCRAEGHESSDTVATSTTATTAAIVSLWTVPAKTMAGCQKERSDR